MAYMLKVSISKNLGVVKNEVLIVCNDVKQMPVFEPMCCVIMNLTSFQEPKKYSSYNNVRQYELSNHKDINKLRTYF